MRATLLGLLLFSCSGPLTAAEPIDDVPLPAEQAARTMVVPDGFQVSLFAAEPDVKQPIGFAIDDRGRLWVAEAYSYPVHGTKAKADRIVILSDTNGDGRADQRKVFYEGLNYVTGVEVGFGGAWVMSPPYFYFIPDRDGDDTPDGPPEVLLDGFGNHANAHNLANGFAWGPDGWLYGTHGRTNWSMIGKPGTPQDQRQRFDGGVYRYHPVRHTWEPYCDGTTNPWGIDWNDVGEPFITNCVNPHLFHAIYGAHYEPWRNRESSQYAYERIPTIADHLHFIGTTNVRAGLGSAEEDAAGGGHAHCGTMIYLGDNWPAEYRNTLFTNNIHGRRINNDRPVRHGSGYIATHGPDLLWSRDPWFMGVTLQAGPDGSVFVIDWSDTGECHSTKNTRRETGRVYKISYGQPPRRDGDLAKLSDRELVELQTHRNEWHVRHARRLLQERSAQGRDMSDVARQLHAMYAGESDVPRKLRALWTLFAIGQLSDEFLLRQLDDANEHIRAWGVQLLCDDNDPPQSTVRRLETLAESDPSALVRLHLASMLQRLKPDDRWEIGRALLAHGEDADDDNLPLLIWYGIEPLVNDDLSRFIRLLLDCKLPRVARFVGRRAASLSKDPAGLAGLVDELIHTQGALQAALLAGVIEGLEGRRSVPLPTSWPAAFVALEKNTDEVAREQALQLALIFDDPRALQTLRTQAADSAAPAATRNRAITALVAKQAPGVGELLVRLVAEPATRRAAVRGLAEFDHPQTVATLLDAYATFDPTTRQDAVQTLSARATWALALVDAIESGRVPRSDVTAYTARQLASLPDPKLKARVQMVWGELRSTPAEKERIIADYKKRLPLASIQQADRAAGRAIFQKTCANCHRIFGAGGAIGPDITGSQRTNLDYLLQTLIDPSAAVARDYQMQIIETSAGRVITGLVVAETKTALTIQTVNEKIVIPTDEIERRTTSPLSIMPEGALQNLTIDQVRQLLAYLMGAGQVELPAQ